MTHTQLKILLDRLDEFEARFEKRLLRLEIWAATAAGIASAVAFAISQHMLHLSN